VTADGRGVAAVGYHRSDAPDLRVADVEALAGQENFPVALRFLPARHRRHLMAIYVFARTADDIGDRAPAPDRMGLLDDLEADVRALYATPGSAAEAGMAEPAASGARPASAAVRGLASTVRACAIPIRLLTDLIDANRQDQVVTRYQTFEDLRAYCRLSADPVGRMVLHVFGSFTEERAGLSDSICTGLQLAEHWQDVAEDLAAGRVYLPADDLRAHGCDEHDLASAHASAQVRELIAFEVRRARGLIDAGAPLIGTLRGAARAAVAGYVAGGRAALAAIAAADYDVLAGPPRPGRRRTVTGLLLAIAKGR
jgi:squalene synthase HpnC